MYWGFSLLLICSGRKEGVGFAFVTGSMGGGLSGWWVVLGLCRVIVALSRFCGEFGLCGEGYVM